MILLLITLIMNKLAVLLLLITFWCLEYQFNKVQAYDDFWVTKQMLQKQAKKLEAEQNRLYQLIK